MFLLNTDVLLALRGAKSGQADPGLVSWAQGVARERLFMSAVSLLDLESGAVRTGRRPGDDKARLRDWVDGQLIPAFEGRILPVDAAVVRRRAQLPYTDTRDALLAATALVHGLTLVTRETAAFRAGRVKLFNPWGYTPDADEEAGDWRQAARSGPLWLKNLFVRT